MLFFGVAGNCLHEYSRDGILNKTAKGGLICRKPGKRIFLGEDAESNDRAAVFRAAGDVRYTMIVSIASTVGGRLVLSYILGVVFHLGVIGIAFAMAADWSIRAVIFYRRLKSGAWKNFHVI